MSKANDERPYALVADDDTFVRMAAADILNEAGFRSIEAEHVDQAIDMLRIYGDDIHLLFTDVHMPPGELTGFDLAQRCAETWPHIGILVASGQAQPGPGDLPDGAVFISKPFSAEIVYDRVASILPHGEHPEPLRRKTSP